MVNIDPAAPCRCRNSFTQHMNDLVKFRARQMPVGIGAPHQGKQVIGLPVLKGDFRDDLLGQDV